MSKYAVLLMCHGLMLLFLYDAAFNTYPLLHKRYSVSLTFTVQIYRIIVHHWICQNLICQFFFYSLCHYCNLLMMLLICIRHPLFGLFHYLLDTSVIHRQSQFYIPPRGWSFAVISNYVVLLMCHGHMLHISVYNTAHSTYLLPCLWCSALLILIVRISFQCISLIMWEICLYLLFRFTL